MKTIYRIIVTNRRNEKKQYYKVEAKNQTEAIDVLRSIVFEKLPKFSRFEFESKELI